MWEENGKVGGGSCDGQNPLPILPFNITFVTVLFGVNRPSSGANIRNVPNLPDSTRTGSVSDQAYVSWTKWWNSLIFIYVPMSDPLEFILCELTLMFPAEEMFQPHLINTSVKEKKGEYQIVTFNGDLSEPVLLESHTKPDFMISSVNGFIRHLSAGVE